MPVGRREAGGKQIAADAQLESTTAIKWLDVYLLLALMVASI